MPTPETIGELVAAQAADERIGLLAGGRRWSHAEVVAAAGDGARWLAGQRQAGPFHVAVLLDNTPEYVRWLAAGALVGAVTVGANPTHRGEELARDLAHTRCQLLVTSPALLPLVDGLDLGPALGVADRANPRVLVVEDPTGLEPLHAGVAAPGFSPFDPVGNGVTPESLGFLLFTSGTSGAPKACRCTQGRLARIATIVAQMFSITADDTCYLPMPLFHSNALMAGWGPALVAGATMALPQAGRFSASGFLTDVRASGATYFNYVGKPLAYVLATPERPDDADNPLVRAFGNEAAAADIAAFGERFGCQVTDGYGSTEGGANIARTPDTPGGALGRAGPDTCVLDPATGQECPPARFDPAGRLVNADAAIGELVNKAGGAGFEGYWDNDEAEAARVRNGWYWTGDLAYRDEAGFFYFAGRDVDWLRVDGENFAAAPVERILERHPDVVVAAVYAVPDTVVGDQVMAALELAEGRRFADLDLDAFLAAQGDLGTKWAPRFVRCTGALPVTATNKVVKRALRAERWQIADPVYWRPRPGEPFARLDASAAAALERALAERSA